MDSNGRRFDSDRDEMSPFPDRMSPFLPDVSPFPGDVSLFRREVRPFHAAISQDSRAVSPLGQQMRLLGQSVRLPARPFDQSCAECRSEMCENDADAAQASQAIVAVGLLQRNSCVVWLGSSLRAPSIRAITPLGAVDDARPQPPCREKIIKRNFDEFVFISKWVKQIPCYSSSEVLW